MTGVHPSRCHLAETWRWHLGCAVSMVSNSYLSIFRTLPSFKQTATPERQGRRDVAGLCPPTSCLTGRSWKSMAGEKCQDCVAAVSKAAGIISYTAHSVHWQCSLRLRHVTTMTQAAGQLPHCPCLTALQLPLASTPLPGLPTTLLSIPPGSCGMQELLGGKNSVYGTGDRDQS